MTPLNADGSAKPWLAFPLAASAWAPPPTKPPPPPSRLFLAVAAGNDELPAGLLSPASEPTACTVGASDSSDARASLSNFGAVLDIFVLEVDILSRWNDDTSSTNVISGTSMDTPHITGLGTYLLALESARDPKVLYGRIQELSTEGVRSDPGLLAKNYLTFNVATA